MLAQSSYSIAGGEKNIDIVVSQLPATIALRYSVAFGKIFSGALSGLIADSVKTSDWSIDIGAAVLGAMASVDEVATPKLLKNFIRESLVSPDFVSAGRSADFDLWFDSTFSGGLDELARLIKFIFDLNFNDSIERAKKKLMLDTNQ